jgi:hypothetical protein
MSAFFHVTPAAHRCSDRLKPAATKIALGGQLGIRRFLRREVVKNPEILHHVLGKQ